MQRVSMAAAVASLLASAHAASLRSTAAVDLPKVANIGTVLTGQDMLVFNLYDNAAKRGNVFEASYARGFQSADGLYAIPDGYDMTQTTQCSASEDTQVMTGETSLMNSQTTEVKFSAGGGAGPVKGTLENSNTFKSMSKEMSSDNSFLQVTSLTCKLYQVQLKSYDMPGLTNNFVQGLVDLRAAQASDVAWNAARFLSEFGTHYMERGSLGSAYVSTSKTTQQQTRMLESSGVSIKVGASASFWGATAGTSVLNSKEQEAGSYFSSLSSMVGSKSIGTVLPTGASKQEVVANWQKMTATSTGLALVGGFQFQRLDMLLSGPGALAHVNQALAKHGFACAQFTQAQIDAVRGTLSSAIDNACAAQGLECDGPLADRPLPPPATVSAVPDGAFYGSLTGPAFNAFDGLRVAQLFGRSSLTYDIRPVKVVTWFKKFVANVDKGPVARRKQWDAAPSVLAAIEITYSDAEGNLRAVRVGSPNGARQCDINIAADERVQRADIRAGEYIDYIALYTSKGNLASGQYSCGNPSGGALHRHAWNGDDYFFGFAGRAGDIVDGLTPVVAKTVCA